MFPSKSQLRRVVAVAYAKNPPCRMSKEEAKLLAATFIPVIITPIN
jgi:hypothetical protein